MEEKTSKEKHSPKKKDWWKSRKNWMGISLLLAILLIVSIFSSGFNFNSSQKAEENILSFLSSIPDIENFEVVSIQEESDVYKVNLNLNGEAVEVFASKDGKLLFTTHVPLTEIEQVDVPDQPTDTGIPKTDKPVFEVFVSPYCPYGLQYEKGLLPVYDLLSEKADISIQLMRPTHMQEETSEILTELCIIEEYDNNAFFKYLNYVIYDEDAAICYNVYHGVNLQTNEQLITENHQDGVYFTECMQPIIDAAIEKAEIDSEVINTCLETKADQLYQDQSSYVSSIGASGSPTPKLNSADLTGDLRGRSPELIKQAVCSAFTDESRPSECDVVLSADTFTPGIGVASTSSVPTNANICG
jgi:thiol-disulfide isomerase/thioredoxin